MGDAPRWVILLSAWSNVFAALTLITSFSVYMIALQFQHTGGVANTGIIYNGRMAGHGWFMVAKWNMFAEGVLWCLGGALLCYRNICNGNAAGAVSQMIISTGGFFFTCSAFGSPANIISLRYLIPVADFGPAVCDPPGTPCGSVGTNYVSFADACPYYGITTFLIATTMGMYSVWGLPKNKLVSPFYGVFCFFIGAWMIGIITLYIPMLAGGETNYADIQFPGTCDGTKTCLTDMPTFAWYQLKPFTVIGAIFLLGGSLIFGIMDNFLCLPQKDDKLLAADGSDGLAA